MSDTKETVQVGSEAAKVGDLYSRNEKLYLVKDLAVGTGEMDDLKMAVLTDGDPKHLCCESSRMEEAGFVEINEFLGAREWNHLASYRLSGGSDEELNAAIDAYMTNAVAITARGCVPFQLQKAGEVGNIKDINTALKDAMGYWKRAVAWLEVEHAEDDETPPTLIVRVSLHGVLFQHRLENALGGKLDEETDLAELIAVVPMFYSPDSEFNPHGTGIDFDLTRIAEHQDAIDDEAADDENYAFSAREVAPDAE